MIAVLSTSLRVTSVTRHVVLTMCACDEQRSSYYHVNWHTLRTHH